MTQSPWSREHRLAEAFVTLADTLVTDFGVADCSTTSPCRVELLEVTGAGLSWSSERAVAGDVLIQ